MPIGQPEYYYVKAICVVKISFAVVFGLLDFWVFKRASAIGGRTSALGLQKEIDKACAVSNSRKYERSHHYTKTK